MFPAFRIRATASAVALMACVALPAQAKDVTVVPREGPTGATRLQEGGATRAPFAYMRFCFTRPKDCANNASGDIKWNRTARDIVVRTNKTVNRGIQPVGDAAEIWSVNVREGDCEDFALTKRRALMRAGLPGSSLRMALARTAYGELHAVLVVKTNVGDFVLDNRIDQVLLSNRTDLKWIKIASAKDPTRWYVVH